MKLIFATNNLHKLKEIRSNLPKNYIISGLREAGIFEEIPETQDSIEGNAVEKAKFIYEKYSLPCFADDTGLEVKALGGRPGVYSARYAGEDGNSKNNIVKLLKELENIDDRIARFRTVIAYISNGVLKTFEGCVQGIITNQVQGKNGFGYDPVFIPRGFIKTFAEMPLREKNKISHRSIALQKFIAYLNSTTEI